MLSKYYLNELNYDNETTYKLIEDFMYEHNKNYNSVKWKKIIRSIMSNGEKQNLVKIDKIGITKNEWNFVSSFGGSRKSRVLFTILIMTKYNNIKRQANDNWCSQDFKAIFKSSHSQMTKTQQSMMMYEFNMMKIIEFSKKINNISFRVNFIDETQDNILFYVEDLENLGLEYSLYAKPRMYIKCEECKKIIKTHNTIRKKICDNCKSIKRKKYKAIKQKEYRNLRKMQNVDS